MATKLKVAVLQGGPSSEAFVSRVSAEAVRAGLAAAGHQVTLLELGATLPVELARLGGAIDVAFPALHGRLGEDGCAQGLLEVLGIPYVGSGVLASAVAAYKPAAKAQFLLAQVPCADGVVIHAEGDLKDSVKQIVAKLGRQVVIKPASGGSAIGVTRLSEASTENDLLAALKACFAVEPVALVERRLEGLEVTCGVLDDPQGVPRALPPTLILPKKADFYDFASKYGSSGSDHQTPPPFDPTLIEYIQRLAVMAHQAVGARDLSRVDFIVDEKSETVTTLEVNTLPGMTPTSLFPEACQAIGLSFPELCDRLVRRAFERPRAEEPRAVPMPS